MYYLVVAKDKDSVLDFRLAHRAAHLSHWELLSGQVRMAGAMLDSDSEDAAAYGSALIIEAGSEGEVRDMIIADPFVSEGVFADDFVICRIRPALGSWLHPD